MILPLFGSASMKLRGCLGLRRSQLLRFKVRLSSDGGNGLAARSKAPGFKKPPLVHAVKAKRAGAPIWHFYAWRGGPKFWEDRNQFPTDPAFYVELGKVLDLPRPSIYLAPAMVDDFLSSAAMPAGERTREDYRKWALRFALAFKDDPAAIFEEKASRGEVNDWRREWMHSPKQYDYAGTVVTRILNWAVEEGKLREHHCHGLPRLYRVDRSEVVWTKADRAAIADRAPGWINRILTAACETGLRPGDLIRLERGHIEATPKGRRIRLKTKKRGRVAWIPVTPEMGQIIDETPEDRALILVSERGLPLTEHRASEGLRQWRDKCGLSADLRLQDARGTAATRLLNHGLNLRQIASVMGWSLRHAAAVIENYAAVSPDESDSLLSKLVQEASGGEE